MTGVAYSIFISVRKHFITFVKNLLVVPMNGQFVK